MPCGWHASLGSKGEDAGANDLLGSLQILAGRQKLLHVRLNAMHAIYGGIYGPGVTLTT